MKAITKKTTKRIWTYIKLIGIRSIAAVILGALGIFVGYQIDYANVDRAPATDYLQYTQFQVQNARVNEDVHFTVCREYQQPYLIHSNLNIYVIEEPGTDNERPVAVFGRTNSTTLNNLCENRVVRNSDFAHESGEYEIRACVNFKVRYDIEKQVCETSNRYRIYDAPQSLQDQIDNLKEQQKRLESELQAQATLPQESIRPSTVGSGDSTSRTPSDSTPARPSTPTAPATPPEEPAEQPQPAEQCTVNLLGLKLLCR